jgi:NitT/TauT family transport system substrate-binding protein
VEPGVTGNKANLGAVVVIDSYVDDMEGFPVAGYMVTTEFAEQNPNTVAAFIRAIEAASQMANDDPDLLYATIGSYTELPPEVIEQLSYPDYRGALDVDTLQRVYDFMLQFEMIEEGLDVGPLVTPAS